MTPTEGSAQTPTGASAEEYYRQAHWEMTQEAARQRNRADAIVAALGGIIGDDVMGRLGGRPRVEVDPSLRARANYDFTMIERDALPSAYPGMKFTAFVSLPDGEPDEEYDATVTAVSGDLVYALVEWSR